MKLLKQFSEFITAREDVRVVRASGAPPPWTDDPILRDYRFCNINREHDRVTVAIRREYKGMAPADLWFHLIVARLFNEPRTLAEIGWTRSTTWRTHITDGVASMRAKAMRVFNPAYIVSTNGKQMDKVEYVIKHVLTPLAGHWHGILPVKEPSCQAWASFLLGFNGMGDFMTNQIVTDYKYTILPRHETKDWSSFVMAGPGTKRGLNRLFGRPTGKSLSRSQSKHELLMVRERLAGHPLHRYFTDLNNLSNSFCEFDKYMRIATGEGKPKQRYHAQP